MMLTRRIARDLIDSGSYARFHDDAIPYPEANALFDAKTAEATFMKFRAAVLNQVGEPLTLDTLDMAPLQPGDVLVKVRASGLCHTDLEVIQGSLAYPLPIVLGHEGAGVVEAVGSAVTAVKPGDHVICSWNPHCGHCFYCERDRADPVRAVHPAPAARASARRHDRA